MRVGQHAPIDPLAAFTADLRDLQAKVADLERWRGVPDSVAGAATDTTDGSGDVIVTHGLGATPTAVVATPRLTSAVIRVQAKSSTTFTLRFLSVTTGAALTATSVGFDWAAHR